ncbi:MAG: cytidine deaminase [Anaerolineae bacterium]|nr:cytidine deaminase [Anaerolineae bacterium]
MNPQRQTDSPTLTAEARARLVAAATQARERAYAPYSNYRVGAALLGAGGKVYTGCNVENATYGATICAERTAVVKAVSEGERAFVAIAIVTADGGTPCGICRQTLFEFAPDLHVIIADPDGHIRSEYALAALLPDGFGPANLKPTTGARADGVTQEG